MRSITGTFKMAALAAAVRAMFEVDLEDALEQSGPAHAQLPVVRADWAWLRPDGLRCAGVLLCAVCDRAGQRAGGGTAAAAPRRQRLVLDRRANLGRCQHAQPGDGGAGTIVKPEGRAGATVAQPGVNGRRRPR